MVNWIVCPNVWLKFLFLVTIVSAYCRVPLTSRFSHYHCFASLGDCSSLVDSSLSSDDILQLVSQTDNGMNASPEVITTVNNWINIKTKEYHDTYSPSTALNDVRLTGNYEVSFVAVNPTMKREGNPAGGGYRGFLGRLVYKNEGLYQNILPAERQNQSVTVVNYITGRLLHLFSLSVVLRGEVVPVSEGERMELMSRYGGLLSGGTVRAKFEPPVLGIGWRGLASHVKDRQLLGTINLGGASSVVLDTPFVCEKLRLGRGSRGSTFVFKRTTEDAADGYKAVLDKARRPTGKLFRWMPVIAAVSSFAGFGGALIPPAVTALLPTYLTWTSSRMWAYLRLLFRVVAVPSLFLYICQLFAQIRSRKL